MMRGAVGFWSIGDRSVGRTSVGRMDDNSSRSLAASAQHVVCNSFYGRHPYHHLPTYLPTYMMHAYTLQRFADPSLLLLDGAGLQHSPLTEDTRQRPWWFMLITVVLTDFAITPATQTHLVRFSTIIWRSISDWGTKISTKDVYRICGSQNISCIRANYTFRIWKIFDHNPFFVCWILPID